MAESESDLKATPDLPDLRHIALHEAAHAVVGTYLGFEVATVSVEPDSRSLGRATFDSEPTGHDGVLVSLAGPAMNFELGLLDAPGCDADAYDAVSSLGEDDEFAEAFMEALELVCRLRSLIDRVANEALQAGTIGGEAVRSIVGHAA